MRPDADAVRWSAFLTGDEQAFEAIFQAYYRELYAYGMRLTGDEELIKDCIQNLFQRWWQRRGTLPAVKEVRPYLFKSMRHEVLAALKTQQRTSRLQIDYSSEFEVQYSPEDFLIAQQLSAEQHARLLAALGRLSSRQREAIYLRFFNGFEYERISEIMSLSYQSTRNLIYQGLKQLRQSLTLALLVLLGRLLTEISQKIFLLIAS